MMDETVDQYNNNTFSLMEHKEEEKTAVTLPHIANWFDCDDSLCVWKVPRKKEFKIHDTVADLCCEI